MKLDLGEAVKFFLEKYFLSTIVAVLVAIVILLATPTDFWMIEKIGKNMFFIFCWGCVFLIIYILSYLAKWIIRKGGKNAHDAQEYDDKLLREAVEPWLIYADNLSHEDKQLIYQFIKTGNQPIIRKNYIFYNSDSLLNSKYVYQTQNQDGSKSIKLTDITYHTYKLIYETYGKISHFY